MNIPNLISLLVSIIILTLTIPVLWTILKAFYNSLGTGATIILLVVGISSILLVSILVWPLIDKLVQYTVNLAERWGEICGQEIIAQELVESILDLDIELTFPLILLLSVITFLGLVPLIAVLLLLALIFSLPVIVAIVSYRKSQYSSEPYPPYTGVSSGQIE